MNTAIDVNAIFNAEGSIKPTHIRLEEDHILRTHKIEIVSTKEESYSGIKSILYNCNIVKNGIKQDIKIRYYINSHKWVTVE